MGTESTTTTPKACPSTSTERRLPDILRISAENMGLRAAGILKGRGLTHATDRQIEEALQEAAQQFGAEREALEAEGLTCEQAVLKLCVPR